MSTVKAGKAIVKDVLSGDTVVLMGQTPKNGPPPEMQLSLASLRAPRLNVAGDEPFAWKSRQFLQSLCIGKPVSFKIEYTVPALNNRKFGNILCGASGSIDASKTIVENGFAAVIKTGPSSDRSSNYDALVAAEETAKESGLGLHTTDALEIAAASAVIERKPSLERCQELYEAMKTTVTEAIVDYVRDGSSLRMFLPAYKCIVSFNLAGVLCPMMYQRDTQKPAPFALIARHFVEIRLLGRRVNIRVGGFSSKNGVFYGKIEHPKGDISAEILKNGFGKTSWTIDYTPNGPSLKKAESDAQKARKGIFHNFKAPARKSKGKARFTGVVSEVVSGDTVVVTVDGSGDTRRVSLSSVITPRQGRRNPKTKEEEPQPFSWQAKEFLRATSIGRKVSVSVEYSRTGNAVAGRPAPLPREFGTVLLNAKADQNLAAMLLGRGYAKTVNHRADDPRSAFYSKLEEKEDAAKKAGKGQWGEGPKAESGDHRHVDLCGDASKAKRYLSYFQRAGQHLNKAVVEYCFNAGKFKLYVPKENCVIFFGLSGVRCPATARPARGGYAARPAEPYGDEAIALVKAALQQRDVQVEVESVDDRGTFLGSLFAKVDGKKRNLSLYLVQQGYGRLIRYSAERSPYYDELIAAESAAKNSKLRTWENYVEQVKVERDDADVTVKSYTAKMTFIDSAQEFYLATTGAESKKIEAGLAALAEKYGDKPEAPTGDDVVEPASKLLVAAQYDGVWYRAKIDKVVRPDETDASGAKQSTLCEITFIDFGNKDCVEPAALRPLPDDLKSSSPLAFQCNLALVKVPGLEKQFGDASAQYLAELTWDQVLSVQDVSAEDGVKSVIITVHPESGEPTADTPTTNELICAEGLGRYKKPFVPKYGRGKPRKTPFDGVAKRIQAAHAAAAKAKSPTGMFAYGDFDSDDDPKRELF